MKTRYSQFRLAVAGVAAVAVLFFSGCDKIEPDQYTLFSGVVAEWTEGTPVNDAVQCAYVEKYTGPQCPNCPQADVTLHAAHQLFGDRLVIVSINHPTGQGEPFPNQFDPRTEDGTTWCNYFGITNLPAAYLNRNTATLFSSSMTNITAAIEESLASQPTVSLEVNTVATDRKLDISVNMQLMQDYASPLTFTVALIEDSLKYPQLMPEGRPTELSYDHNHMLRDVITDVWGASVEMQGNSGECRKAKLTYHVSNSDIVLKNCHVVAFVSDKESRQVLNCASCKIDDGE